MGTRRLLRSAAAIITAIGCLLVVLGLTVAVDRGSLRAGQADHLRVPAAEATWTNADAPDAPAGPAELLRSGDTSGGAVTYLKFEIPYHGGRTDQAVLRLASAGEPLPGLVELVAVPDLTWAEHRLTWANAPVLGPVVQSVRPGAGDDRVEFDVTGLVAPGAVGFAVTVPADRGDAVFAGTGEDRPALYLSGVGPAPSGSVRPVVPGPALSEPPEDAVAPRVPPPQVSPPAPPGPQAPECAAGELLVPSCGVLWGVAPGAHTSTPRDQALVEFEQVTGRRQDVYHAYHRAESLFPTEDEVEIAAGGRILFLNWKPLNWSWAQIADGHPRVDSYLDRLAEHIGETFDERFFFTIHHEPENNVRPSPGSGWEPGDYAAMYRYVVEGLRERGVDNLVTVMNYMAYVPWNTRPWFPDLYPGDDVVDWISWDAYAYSDPGYGYGDFGEMMNRRSSQYPDWPGFYAWATETFPDKPFMLSEWGVWFSRDNPEHMSRFYDSVARQTPLFPRVKAMVYFETPSDQRDRDSRPTRTEAGLAAYQRLGSQPYFQVRLPGVDGGG